MKTMPCPPKVIIHRLGCQPAVRLRISPSAVVVVLLVLAAFAASTVHSRQTDGPHSLRHLSSLR